MTKDEITRRLIELSESPLQKVLFAIVVFVCLVFPGAIGLSAGLSERIVLPVILLAIPILLSMTLLLKRLIEYRIKPPTMQPTQVLSVRRSAAKVIAVIPAYNEEQQISDQVSALRTFVDEIIVVDDHSSDRTADAARGAGAAVIQGPASQGLRKATNRGIQVALLREPTELLICEDAAVPRNDWMVFFRERTMWSTVAPAQHRIFLACWPRTYLSSRRKLREKLVAALLGVSWREYTASAAFIPVSFLHQIMPFQEGLSPILQCVVFARRLGVQPQIVQLRPNNPSTRESNKELHWRDAIRLGLSGGGGGASFTN